MLAVSGSSCCHNTELEQFDMIETGLISILFSIQQLQNGVGWGGVGLQVKITPRLLQLNHEDSLCSSTCCRKVTLYHLLFSLKNINIFDILSNGSFQVVLTLCKFLPPCGERIQRRKHSCAPLGATIDTSWCEPHGTSFLHKYKNSLSIDRRSQ